MELRDLIRDTLKEKMAEQFKTLTAFAKASGVSQSYLSKIFGETAVDISPTILSKLLAPLQISLSQFFEEVEKKKDILNIQLSEDELKELLNMLPNGEEKRGFIQKLREKLPELPKWLTFEEHVKTAQLHLKNDLVPGVAGREQQKDTHTQ